MPNRIIRSPSFGVRRAGPRRQTEWFPSSDSSAAAALAAATFVFDQSLTTAEKAKRPFTVTRTVGSLFISSDQSAAIEFPFGALGFIVVSDKASATGVTAVPDPITQEGSDGWFVYRSFGVSGNPEEGRVLHEFPFDSRAQRKVQDGEDIAVVISNASVHGLSYILKFRLLIKVA